MKWFVLWFTFSGQPITGLFEKKFDTEAQCIEYANSRIRMMELMHERPRFECKAFPFVVPKA
jgi:hypothetical protein